MTDFVRLGTKLVPRAAITEIDASRLARLEVTVRGPTLHETLRDGDAIDLVLRLAPALLEGPRLRFARRAWLVHNVIGHPLLQLCASLGHVRLGMWLHDVTIPRPASR